MYIESIARFFGCGHLGCAGAQFQDMTSPHRQQDISIGQVAKRAFLILATALSTTALFATGHPLAAISSFVFGIWTTFEFLGIDPLPTPHRTHNAAHPVIISPPPQPLYVPPRIVPAPFYMPPQPHPMQYVATTSNQRAPVGRHGQNHYQARPAAPIAIASATMPINSANSRAPVGRSNAGQHQQIAPQQNIPMPVAHHPIPATARASVGRQGVAPLALQPQIPSPPTANPRAPVGRDNNDRHDDDRNKRAPVGR